MCSNSATQVEARWRLAIVAIVLVALSATIVLTLDDENSASQAVVEAVRIRISAMQNGIGSTGDDRSHHTRFYHKDFLEFSNRDLQGMSPKDQDNLLHKLAEQKRTLKTLLHEQIWSLDRLREPEDMSPFDSGLRDDVDFSTRASRLVRTELEAEAREKRRRAEVIRDETELEFEEAEKLREQMQMDLRDEKVRKEMLKMKRQAHKKAEAMWRMEHEGLRDDQMVQDVPNHLVLEAAKHAAELAATKVAKNIEHDMLHKVQKSSLHVPPTPQTQSEVQAISQPTTATTDTSRKQVTAQPQHIAASAIKPSLKRQPEVVHERHRQTTRNSDVKAMMAQIAKIKAALVKKSRMSRAKAETEDLMAIDPQIKAGQDDATKVVDPTISGTDPFVVKQLSTQDATVEAAQGGAAETQSEAENYLLYYAIWASVGALVIGLLATVIYCACQQPRDRPWGMPPKRQF